jgi:hypothetical protein
MLQLGPSHLDEAREGEKIGIAKRNLTQRREGAQESIWPALRLRVFA